MREFILSLTAGIVSGIVATILCFLIAALVKPKVKIAPNFCIKKTSDGVTYYQIKIVNLSLTMLTDIKYTMYFRERTADGNIRAFSVQPMENFCFISPYRINGKGKEYAVKLKYIVDESKIKLTDNTELVFDIFATHNISKNVKHKRMIFKKNNGFENGTFEKGKSLEIIVPNG